MRAWLRNIREEKQLTQSEVADAVNIARTSYAMYEQGKRNPSVETAKKIALVLKFDWTIFFD